MPMLADKFSRDHLGSFSLFTLIYRQTKHPCFPSFKCKRNIKFSIQAFFIRVKVTVLAALYVGVHSISNTSCALVLTNCYTNIQL